MSRRLITSILVGGALFVIFALALPAYNAVRTVGAAVAERQSLLESRRQQLDNVQKLAAQLKTNRQNVANTEYFLPQNRRLDQVVSALDALATQSGLQLKSLQASDNIDTAVKYNKVIIKMDLNGSYPSFANFVKETEKNLRLSDLLEFSVTSEGGIGSNNLNITAKVQVYNLLNQK